MDLGATLADCIFMIRSDILLITLCLLFHPQGLGSENIGFMTIPFVALLAVAKRIPVSSTVLISAFHGFSLAASFLFVYLSIVQLLHTSMKSERLKELSALAGGLLYVFSPISIFGWDKVLITHNYVFLNPVMFYLMLRYVVTDRFYYLLGAAGNLHIFGKF